MARTATSTGTAVAKASRHEVMPRFTFNEFRQDFVNIAALCDMLAKSGKTGELRSKESIVAVALRGAELGIPPMTAIDQLHVISGRITASASLLQSLVYREFPSAKFEIEESDSSCTVTLSVPDRQPYTAVYSMSDAQMAGLSGKDNWRKNPKAMLRARAIAAACRVVCPDVIMGMYASEEVDQSEPEPKSFASVNSNGEAHAEPEPVVEADPEPDAIDAEIADVADREADTAEAEPEPVVQDPAPQSEPQPIESATMKGPVNQVQLSRLKALKDRLNISAQEWIARLAEFQVDSATKLTMWQADTLINKLQLNLSARQN